VTRPPEDSDQPWRLARSASSGVLLRSAIGQKLAEMQGAFGATEAGARSRTRMTLRCERESKHGHGVKIHSPHSSAMMREPVVLSGPS
jgi:hypothetical protein